MWCENKVQRVLGIPSGQARGSGGSALGLALWLLSIWAPQLHPLLHLSLFAPFLPSDPGFSSHQHTPRTRPKNPVGRTSPKAGVRMGGPCMG